MAGTTWNSLTADTLAKASDLNENLAWLEGDIRPQTGGNATDATYDLGTSTIRWRNLYLSSSLVVDGAAASPPATNTVYADNIVKGWVNFDATATLTVNGSFNVESVADLGTGRYRVNWNTDFANANYSIATGIGATSNNLNRTINIVNNPAAGTIDLDCGIHNTSLQDSDNVCLIAIGDQ